MARRDQSLSPEERARRSRAGRIRARQTARTREHPSRKWTLSEPVSDLEFGSLWAVMVGGERDVRPAFELWIDGRPIHWQCPLCPRELHVQLSRELTELRPDDRVHVWCHP